MIQQVAPDFRTVTGHTEIINKMFTSDSELSIQIKIKSNIKWTTSHNKDISVIDQETDLSCFGIIRNAFQACFDASTASAPGDRYRLVKEIGRGSFGKVCEIVRLSDKTTFACKFQSKKKTLGMFGGNLARAVKSVRSETELGLKLSHPNVVKVYEVFETSSQILIIMERMYGGSLCSYAMRRDLICESHVANIVSQIVSALKYIHSVGLVHRDVKLENIMLMSRLNPASKSIGIVKLIDFGCSRTLYDGSNAESFVGSGYFAAPEIFLRLGHNNKADMWSVGVVTFVCLSGKFPFRDISGPVGPYVRGLGTKPHVKPTDWIGISKNALDFTRKLLCFEPSKRMSAKEALNHTWLG